MSECKYVAPAEAPYGVTIKDGVILIPIGRQYKPPKEVTWSEWRAVYDSNISTIWVKRLYAKKYDDPAYLYVRRNEIKNERRIKIKFGCLVLLVFMCILASVK